MILHSACQAARFVYIYSCWTCLIVVVVDPPGGTNMRKHPPSPDRSWQPRTGERRLDVGRADEEGAAAHDEGAEVQSQGEDEALCMNHVEWGRYQDA